MSNIPSIIIIFETKSILLDQKIIHNLTPWRTIQTSFLNIALDKIIQISHHPFFHPQFISSYFT